MVDPDTGETITWYQKLARDSNPEIRETWQIVFGKEIGRMAQSDDNTKTKGKSCIFVMNHVQIPKIHAKGKPPTYACIVVNFRLLKSVRNRVRITAGGNLVKLPRELTTRTADITATKIVWNSVISTKGARYACLDVGNIYLETSLRHMNIRRCHWHCFRPGHASNIIWTRTRTAASCAGKFARLFMDYRTQED